jgi:Stress responsive A/B Barrel Domain
MLTHIVLFWLKPELTPDQRAAFRTGLESLRKVNTIEAFYTGSPAAVPPRPIIDRSYSFCLTTVFKDVAAHDAYQVDPIHKAFVETCQQYWTRVQIFDSE